MKGDFSRFTFDPARHYRSVRTQQGRVQLDADWNEQADILDHLHRAYAVDVFGAQATPDTQHGGFAISPLAPDSPVPLAEHSPDAAHDFVIGAGRIYVGGVLCENEMPVRFSQQPDYPESVTLASLHHITTDAYIAYLDVWERHISPDQDPTLQEIALGGADTTTRTKTVWQVKLETEAAWHSRTSVAKPTLSVRFAPEQITDNQLHRIEIHSASSNPAHATFTWSAENGSIAYPIRDYTHTDGTTQLVLGRLDARLRVGDWVEVCDDATELAVRRNALVQVTKIDRQFNQVTLSGEAGLPVSDTNPKQVESYVREAHPLLRRWDGAPQSVQRGEWQEIGNSVHIRFDDPAHPTASFHVGDYWVFPLRTDSGDAASPAVFPALPPHGIIHRYAPLAKLEWSGSHWRIEDVRTLYRPMPTLHRDLAAAERAIEQLADDLAAAQQKITDLADELRRVNALHKAIPSALSADYQCVYDLAEGDVVALDPNKAQTHVTRVDSDTAKHVIGVVVKNLGKDGDGWRCRVALSGAASCRIIGEVQSGDLLVASNVAGCAKRRGFWFNRGRVVGKALEAHSDSSERLIRVIVALS